MRKNASTPSTLEIHLLGPFRISVDGQAIDGRAFTRRKPKQLIKLLALQAHHQLHREQAMEFLWPDSDPESAANNLHKAIHMARHALEPALKSVADSHFILTQGQQVSLRAPGASWIDVEAFEQAAADALKSSDTDLHEQALALYEGDLLIEDPYEDWTAGRREHLRALRHDLLVKLARLYEVQGKHQPAIGRLQEIVALDPTYEEAHRQLMRLYALTGNCQQAIHQYQKCCEDLRRELDARPEQATVKLHQQIVSGGILPLDKTEGLPELNKTIDSIAILPLVNASADPGLEYLSDGITESIINSLSQLPALRVMAWGTVARYKGREIAPGEVGRDLRVRAVMLGRVLEVGERLVVKTELVDVANGSQLWGEQYNRRPADIFAMQEEIAKEISEKLRLRLTGEEKGRLAKRYTDSTEAYQLYLKGRYYSSRWTKEGYKKGIEYFKQAIEADPGYALAYVGLADIYGSLGSSEALALPLREAWLRAKAAAVKALEIDENLAEAHTSLALIKLNYEWDWEETEEGFRRALKLNPNYANAYHWYSHYLIAMGRMEESLSMSFRARELDPLDPEMNTHLAFHYYFARLYDLAIEHAQKTLEIDPNFHEAYWFLGWAYEQKGQYEEAIAQFQKAAMLGERNFRSLAYIGSACALLGRREEAQKVLEELKELSKQIDVSAYYLALIYVGLGEKDRAFESLNKAYEERSQWLVYLKVEPTFESLRSDPRFTDLLRRVGLV